jgi:hypothetical protein
MNRVILRFKASWDSQGAFFMALRLEGDRQD